MTLQLALLLIGVMIIAVVFYTTRRRDKAGRQPRREPLAGLEDLDAAAPSMPTASLRREPSLDAQASGERRYLRADAPPPAPPPAASDPVTAELESLEEVALKPLNLNPGFDPPGTGPQAVADAGAPSLPNEQLDFILHLPSPGPVSRRAALGIYKQNEYKLEYPRRLYGQRYQTNFWSVVQHDSEATQYSDLKLALQLIDGRGPVNESELNTFMQVGLKLADALHRPAKFLLSFEDALAQAQRLQKFWDEHDVIAGVSVAADAATPFKGHAIVAAMERHGLTLGDMQIFHRARDGRSLYSVSSLYKPGHFNPAEWESFRTAGLAIFMSVPVVEEPTAVFEQMMETATGLATFLGGRLLDQEHRPLTEKGIDAIRAQIRGIESRMRTFGIPAGSGAALRLFSGPSGG